MKTKDVLLSAIFICLMVPSWAQTLKNGQVIGVIALGSGEYSIIQEDNSENYFKTSPHVSGELVTNQTVQLEFAVGETEQAEVIANTLTKTLYAELMQEEQNPGSTILPTFTEPSVENGILFFNSKQHIAEVYDALVDFTDLGDIDEQLDIFQAEYIGYISFREHIIAKYNWLDGSLTQQQLSDLYYDDFIADEIKKTFLNEERMVGVDDSIYYFHNLGDIYRIHKDNDTLISLLEEIEREDEPLDPADATFQHILEMDLINGHEEGETRGSISVETESEDSCWYVTRLIYEPDAECDPYTKGFSMYLVEYFQPEGGVRDSAVYWAGGMELEIDWKDGSDQIVTGYNFEGVYHVYPDYDYYRPQTTLTFIDRYGNEQSIEDGTESADGFKIEFSVDASCGKEDALDYEHDNEGGFQIVARTWINDNILGNHIGSFTHLYEWQGDGTLELVKGTLYTDVYGKFYNGYCDYEDDKFGDKLRKRRRKIQKTKNKWFSYYRYDAIDGIISKHWFVEDGAFSEIHGHVNPCD